MKKGFKFLVFIIFLSSRLFAQFGEISSLQIVPANPTDADEIEVVVEVLMGSSPCTLDNSIHSLQGNTIEMYNFYCGGMLTTICNRIDTINLGTFSAGTYNLNVYMAVGCGPYSNIDSSLSNSFTVSVFLGVKSVIKQNNYSFYPNPTSNSIINIQAPTFKQYTLVCYNSIGQLAFELSNLAGNQTIDLPKEKGVYFIKITDTHGHISILKCINQAN